MPGTAVVLVFVSFLAVSLIVDSSFISKVYASKPGWGPTSCSIMGQTYPLKYGARCCATETDQQGLEITWCTDCYAAPDGTISDCGPRYNSGEIVEGRNPNPPTNPNPTAGKNIGAPIGGITTGNNTGTPPPGSIIKVPPGNIYAPPTGNTGNTTNPGNNTGTPHLGGIINNQTMNLTRTYIPPVYTLPPSGNNMRARIGGITTSNNTGTPPGSIIKVPPGTINAPPATNNSTGNTIARGIGTYSPTGYCVRSNHYSCLPCDPGLPGGRDTCVPSSEWPGPPSFKSAIIVNTNGTKAPIGGITTCNNTSTGGGTRAGVAAALGGITTCNNTSTGGGTRAGVAAALSNSTNVPTTSNNTSTLKLSPLTGHHHHKGGTSVGNTNSTGH